MKLSQVITRSSLVVLALLNLSLATRAIAEPIVVTRGPNGAGHVVKADKVPVDAKIVPNHKTSVISVKANGEVEQKASTRLIQRGPNGAFFQSSK